MDPSVGRLEAISMYIHNDFVDELEKWIDGELVEATMKGLSNKVEKLWREKASQRLNTSKEKYLAGINVEASDHGVMMTLSGFLPTALEQGTQRYDLKPGLLGSALFKIIPIGKDAGKTPDFKTLTPASKGWWHPGFQAMDIIGEVTEEIGDLAVDAFNESLSSRQSI